MIQLVSNYQTVMLTFISSHTRLIGHIWVSLQLMPVCMPIHKNLSSRSVASENVYSCQCPQQFCHDTLSHEVILSCPLARLS